MSAVVEHQDVQLPAPVMRRGITESQWRTMMNLFPGAKGESVVLAWDYCTARRLDPLKKPCHIVPMNVKDSRTNQYSYRDVIMPGIYEYRTTAHRTGEYLGHSIPEYGPAEDYKGVMAPTWCSITVYRWNPLAKMKAEFPVRLEFHEIAVTKKDGNLNDRWSSAPKMQLTKCAEAAALREGFPDELGGTHTVEEMEGRIIDATALEGSASAAIGRVDPRGDTSGVDWELRDRHVAAITDLFAEYGSDEVVAAEKFREYIEAERLNEYQELWITIDDKLAADGIISKSNMKKYLKVPASSRRPDGR